MDYGSMIRMCEIKAHGELDYKGRGDYICPICGREYQDDDFEEGLSVYVAAEIWASRGKDEDCMFGYSEEELEKAL